MTEPIKLSVKCLLRSDSKGFRCRYILLPADEALRHRLHFSGSYIHLFTRSLGGNKKHFRLSMLHM